MEWTTSEEAELKSLVEKYKAENKSLTMAYKDFANAHPARNMNQVRLHYAVMRKRSESTTQPVKKTRTPRRPGARSWSIEEEMELDTLVQQELANGGTKAAAISQFIELHPERTFKAVELHLPIINRKKVDTHHDQESGPDSHIEEIVVINVPDNIETVGEPEVETDPLAELKQALMEHGVDLPKKYCVTTQEWIQLAATLSSFLDTHPFSKEQLVAQNIAIEEEIKQLQEELDILTPKLTQAEAEYNEVAAMHSDLIGGTLQLANQFKGAVLS